MKREIKFRGMSLIVGFCEWRYGFFSTYPKGAHITTPDGECWPVAIESVGQFTGLEDKNGREIYESDILKFSEIMSDKALAVKYSCGMFVVYDPNCCSVCKDGPGYTCSLDEAIMYPLADEEGNHAEVIGNIYENPELLSK